MTILYRTRVGILERVDCEARSLKVTPHPCTNPGAYAWSEGPVTITLCSQHDLALRGDCEAEGDLVLGLLATNPQEA